MTLSAGVKSTLDGMSDVDKALVVLYVGGVDDPTQAKKIGTSFVRAYYPEHDPAALTNDDLARGLLLQVRQYIKSVHIGQAARDAAEAARETARQTADDEVQYRDIGDLPPAGAG